MIRAPTSDLKEKVNFAVVLLFSRSQDRIPHDAQCSSASATPSHPGSAHTGPLLVPPPGALLPGVCLAGSSICSQGWFSDPMLHFSTRPALLPFTLQMRPPPPHCCSPKLGNPLSYCACLLLPAPCVPCTPTNPACSRISPRRTGAFACLVA